MRIPFLSLITIGVIVACSSPTSACACSPPPPAAALVIGTVSSVGDLPVAGAVITPSGTLGSCPGSGPSTVFAYGASATTDAAGRYRLLITRGGTSMDSVCVTLVARRSALANADTLLSASLALKLEYTPYADTTRVDLRFP